MVFQAEDRTRAKRQQSEVAIQMALQGKWKEAADLNRQILDSFPTDVDACNRLGKALTEMGKYNDARDSYMKALEIDPLNSIAQKNLNRLATLGKVKKSKMATQKLAPQMFIEETGKTGVTLLQRPNMEVAARLTAGDQVKLARQKSGVLHVVTMDDELIGEVEPRLAQRLSRLIEGGNEYVAAIASMTDIDVKVFIRETFQHASQTGKLSFPAQVTEPFRPYVKERLLRNDRDTFIPSTDDDDESWSPSAKDEDVSDDDDDDDDDTDYDDDRGSISVGDSDDE